MNVKRFTARTSREALALVRQAFGEDAVVMSTRPCADGVEVLAMAPESLQQLERVAAAPAAEAPRARAAAPRLPAARVEPRVEPSFDAGAVDDDVEQLEMSTLSFQDYVRERMLKRRQTELAREATEPRQPGAVSTRRAEAQREEPPVRPVAVPAAEPRTRAAAPAIEPRARAAEARREPPVLREEIRHAEPLLPQAPVLADGAPRRDQVEMMEELRSMRGLIEQRFGALAFMEKLQRQPRQAQLTQKLLGCGFSPSLVRKLVEGLPGGCDELAWAAGVLERNLATGERESPLEDVGGVYALVGPTGVGKTTSTAKLAAAFATRHGAANLGLITLDAYRVGAHEQLRTYGRILGVPVHTAHDRASLEDLLDLLSAKKMVLIDTAGMAQRDARTRELLDMLSHRSINKLLVVNAAAQGETIEEVLLAYGAAACRGIVLSKMDEAVKLAPALDALIRYKLKVLAVANGQRVPEDWHRLSANALVQRALRGGGSPAWRMDSADMNLVFAGVPTPAAGNPLHA
ncbi:flagellar biosynthesis protein FlhF [Rubrivivax sp. JA1024]|uniref:flagellar biosynthesis protein FlhF n=1 Tax=Rubrivivax sp. JA1026 TaxID=2710888 RepID=UPI0013E99615|nr:flagellar biosynthesis protein FlhF [Rubrivivax sp. JA1026]MCD0418463.1 flagellar biosynthesis protein FlhF [Rubrivivax sp. JA1024]